MNRVNRFDRGQIRAPVRTPQGYLKLDAVATRTGVFLYANPDGSIRRELRHPDDVFRADSMASLAQVTVTDLHPQGLLDASNTAQYARGWTGETPTRDNQHLMAPVTITDAALIGDVEAKRKVVSTLTGSEEPVLESCPLRRRSHPPGFNAHRLRRAGAGRGRNGPPPIARFQRSPAPKSRCWSGCCPSSTA